MKLFKIISTLLFLSSLCYSQVTVIEKINGDLITKEEIDETVGNLMDSASVTGLCLAVLNENELVYLKTYGYRNKEKNEFLDENTVILGASFSKVVFAYIVMQLVQENIIDLDTPIYMYLEKPLPEYSYYSDLVGNDLWKLLTARICLNHTTGFPNSRTFNPNGNEKLEFFFEPGTHYAYSGEGISLLQFVVETITKKSLEELALERVFKPLGMQRTSYIWQSRFEDNYAVGHDIFESTINYERMTEAIGGGSLLTTISDYAKFIEAIMQGKGLDKDILQEMLSPSIRIKSLQQFPTLSNKTTDEYDSLNLSYGLGCGLFFTDYGKAFFKEGHGNGWQNYNVNFIDKKISIIIMTNSNNGEKIFKDLLEKIIGDTYTPWKWEGYISYYLIEPASIGVYIYDIIFFDSIDKAIETYKKIEDSPFKKNFIFNEDELNSLGYQMIKENKLGNAIKLFKLNTEEYPKSANTYDSLGEAYFLNGDYDLSLKCYEKALELDPELENVTKMIEEISKKFE